ATWCTTAPRSSTGALSRRSCPNCSLADPTRSAHAGEPALEIRALGAVHQQRPHVGTEVTALVGVPVHGGAAGDLPNTVGALELRDLAGHRRGEHAVRGDVDAALPQQRLCGSHLLACVAGGEQRPRRVLGGTDAECAADRLPQLGQASVKDLAGAFGGIEVAVTHDRVGAEAVLTRDPRDEAHQRVRQLLGDVDVDVDALLLDADARGVVVGHVRALHVLRAALDDLERVVPAFGDVATTAVGELLPRIAPAVVHVERLDVAG